MPTPPPQAHVGVFLEQASTNSFNYHLILGLTYANLIALDRPIRRVMRADNGGGGGGHAELSPTADDNHRRWSLLESERQPGGSHPLSPPNMTDK